MANYRLIPKNDVRQKTKFEIQIAVEKVLNVFLETLEETLEKNEDVSFV